MPLSSPRFNRDAGLLAAVKNQPPLKVGAKGQSVKILQQALLDLGIALPRSTKTGRPDGIFGPETEAALKAFQRANSLKADGIAGTLTLSRLDQIFSAKDEALRLKETAEAHGPLPFGKFFIT
jgi:peptidoglycan hydrolase-like protein with peptidoglycan-binding domain